MPNDVVPDMVPRSELERAVADERRKRRKVQIALAVATGVILVGGGVFAWWREWRAAEARLMEAQREAEKARAGAAEMERKARNAEAMAALLDRCEEALRAGDRERAEAALAEADRRLAQPGGEFLFDRLERSRHQLDALRALDQVENLRWVEAGKTPAVAPPPREVERP